MRKLRANYNRVEAQCTSQLSSVFQVVYLTNNLKFPYDALITATPVIGIGTPLIQRRTSAVQALFLCLQFTLWQRAQESRQARRSLCSGSSNPAYAVALLLGTNGGSQSSITKETAMSTRPACSALSLNVSILNPNDVLLALLSCLELAADHPSRSLAKDAQADLLRFAQQLVNAIEQGSEQ